MVVNQGWQLGAVIDSTPLDYTPLLGWIIINKGNGIKLIALQQSHFGLCAIGLGPMLL